ncbi:MAG: hypothetical protein ABIF71_09570 [Planctomycetota bacterium]
MAEMAGITGAGINTVRRALVSLYAQGLIRREMGDRAMLYSAAPGNPAVTYFKIFTLLQTLQPLLKRLRPQTHRIVLYGPCAEGADTAASDINLFIVAPNPTAVLNITDTLRIPLFSAVGARHAVPSSSTGRKDAAKTVSGQGAALPGIAAGVFPPVLPEDRARHVALNPEGASPLGAVPLQIEEADDPMALASALTDGLVPSTQAEGRSTQLVNERSTQDAASALNEPPTARRVAAILMPPGDEIPILTEDPEAAILAIESGLLLWQDPARTAPHLVTKGGGRHKIAILTNWLKWKKSADPHWASEPYVISMAFDSHTARGEMIEPFFNALPFPNVLAGDTLPMLGQGHFFYGPRDPGEFVALSVFWMEKDAGVRDLGQTISDLQANKKIKAGIKALGTLAGEGLARLLPGLGAVAAITAEALKLNKDDEIFRSDGVYLREYDPPYDIGTDKVIGNVFLDFNIKVIGIGR